MKVYLSTDFEGTAGIVDWEQVLGPSAHSEAGRRLLLNEVNAAIDGAAEAGAEEFLVNDSHWTMHNLAPEKLHGNASYLAGWHKPLYMMEGLDSSFDAVFFIAYHGGISARHAVLSHTYNPFAIYEVRLNGIPVGESAINALVALHHGVPVALVTGDEATEAESRPFLGDFEVAVVKRSITRSAANNLHPEEACKLIKGRARTAIEKLENLSVPAIQLPAALDIWFLNADMAEAASWIGGVERTEPRAVRIAGDEPLALYRRFVTTVLVTRPLVEGR